MIYPKNFEQKIGFTAIRQILTQLCTFVLGAEEVERVSFVTDYEQLTLQLNETNEMYAILNDDTLEFPMGNFYDLRASLQRIRVEGLFLDESEVFDLRRTLESVRLLTSFFSQLEETVYPNLKTLSAQVVSLAIWVKEIDCILDKFGKIKDNATPELAKIRKEIQHTQGSVSRTLQAILRQAKSDGLVDKDVTPTLRDGRLVIPISPMYKRKIGGIVHDESATGKTVFVEPQQVVDANNKIRELEGEERREIVRILLRFTDAFRPFIPDVIDALYFLGKIDFLRAKAVFAGQINAIRPIVLNETIIEWNKAIHPLLYLSLQKQHKSVVPLNINLNQEQRILVISGPNAGGKSVCLKSVALLQYMLQCGLLVPIHESSRMGIFSRLFIDIGDEQSIENDLSTYSSHLLNMKFFVKNSNAKTLLLIDEFGGGTEPQIGGAIAEATLNKLNENKTFGVITTHYTNLKHFADSTNGIVNGAMLYDRHLMQPLFMLEMGNPGSSFAVEIARKIGLPETIIADAVNKVGAEHVDYDKHLQDIVRDKRYWENKRQKIQQKEKQLNEKIAFYEAEMAEIKRKRKEIIDTARQESKSILQKTNATIENTIRIIKESQAEKEATRAAREKIKNYEENLTQKLNTTPKIGKKTLVQSERVSSKQTTEKAAKTEIAVHANVRLKGQNAIGKIMEIKGKNALVAFGDLKSNVNISKLEVISHNQLKTEQRKTQKYQLIQPSASTTSDEVRGKKLNFKHDIDVRGMRGEEALQAVIYFIDDAIMVNAGTVRILHGTGTGILRQLIREYLNTIGGVKSFKDEHVEFGGAGITIVQLD